MKLKWTPPKDNGGSKVINYVIEIKDFNRRINWIELDTTNYIDHTYLVTNLEKGSRYSFRVIAENKYGRSEPTELAKPVESNYQFNVPNPPTNCVAKEVTKTSCTIEFQPPAFDGGSPITGYIIERRQVATSRWLRCTKEPTKQLANTINDLIDGLEYEFRIIAENLAGQSDPSEPSKSFIAKNPFERPGPPINLRVGEITRTSVELTWEPPFFDGGSAITEYRIEKRNQKTMKWQLIENFNRIINTFYTIETGIKESHHYEFRVVAVNKAGEGEPSKPTDLIEAKDKIIGDKPALLEPIKDVKVMVGETAHLIAKLRCKPPPVIKWFMNERNLSLKDDFISTFTNNIVELTIKNVQIKDAGEYKLNVINPLGELNAKANLIVLKKPSISYDQKLNKNIEIIAVKQNLHISCDISGFPRPNIKWYHDREELKPEESRAIIDYGEQFATIRLNKIKRNESGEYKITAENEVGKCEASFFVKVLDVPMPPQNLNVTEISSYNCKLTWNSPKDDGNAPITSYYIEKLDTRRSTYIRLDKTSLNEHFIDKLQKGESYQFRVIAENKIGLSDPCEMIESFIAKSKFDVPGVPGIPDISEIDKTSCKISWDEPKKDGGKPIMGYFIEKKSGSKWIRVNKNQTPNRFIILKDLVEGSEYEFRVCAVNSEGEGPFSKNSEPIIAKKRFDKPDPPIDVEVQNITKSGCLLTWRPPKKIGGQPIIRYHVEMRTKGEYKFYRFTDDFISECEYEIRDLIENQDYEFRIIAENKQGESLPSEPSRKIKAREHIHGIAPQIDDMPTYGNLIGSQGKIEVRVIGNPTPSIKWKKGSRNLNLDSSKYSFSYAQSIAVLFISNLNVDDNGQYTIEADNVAGSDSKTCKFLVYAPPKIDYENKYKKPSIVSIGSNFRFSCQVNGCPTPEITWLKDDSKVKKGDKPILDNPTESQHYLTIKQCDRTDSGFYYIKAVNPYGKDEAKFEVQIVDVPDKPKGPLDITLETNQARMASLNWRAPKWDGGSELTGYTIECSKILDPSFSKSII